MTETDNKEIESWSDSDDGSLEATDAKGSNTGRWTKEEHETFLLGLSLYGRDWKKVATAIKTRTPSQIRSHAQKYFQKLSRSPIQTDGQTHALGEEDKDAFTVLEYLESTLKSLKRRRDELDCSASLKGSLANLSSVRESETSYIREPLSTTSNGANDVDSLTESENNNMEEEKDNHPNKDNETNNDDEQHEKNVEGLITDTNENMSESINDTNLTTTGVTEWIPPETETERKYDSDEPSNKEKESTLINTNGDDDCDKLLTNEATAEISGSNVVALDEFLSVTREEVHDKIPPSVADTVQMTAESKEEGDVWNSEFAAT